MLSALQGLRQVVYTGSSMNPEDETWALEKGIPITVSTSRTPPKLILIIYKCLYASTEAGENGHVSLDSVAVTYFALSSVPGIRPRFEGPQHAAHSRARTQIHSFNHQ